MTERTSNRRSVHDWDDPHFEYGHRSWYNPLLWALVFIDLFWISWWCLWHKYQSLRADRWLISVEAHIALGKIEGIKQRHNLSKSDEEALDFVEQKIIRMTDEQNIQSEFIERYREDHDG